MSISKINTNSIAAGASPTMTDLTLSGGIYLGGTGAANYLNDYEEGNWTPVLDASTTSPTSPTSGFGRYTKIGNQVILFGMINNISVSGASGPVNITGLPFTSSSGLSGGNIPGTLYTNEFIFSNAADRYAVVEAPNDQDHLLVRIIRDSTNAVNTPCTTSFFVEGATDLRFQVTYRITG